MQLQLFGPGSKINANAYTTESESKKFFVNPAFQEAFQKGFGQNHIHNQSKVFPFADGGFSSISKSKKVFVQEKELGEEMDHLLDESDKLVTGTQVEKKKGDT